MQKNEYRPDIDGLRTVAVLAVVAFHAFPIWLPGGFVGVDVFFVISGFLITSIISKEIEARRFSFLAFYARRAQRLFPALAVVLSVTLAAGWFLLLTNEYAALGKHTAAGAGFVANIANLLEAGYFDTSAKFKPLLHLWSLGVEEQFYFVWPPLLLLAAMARWSWRWVAAGVALVSFACCLYVTQSNPYAAFFLPVTRFWELMAGALLARIAFGAGSIGATDPRFANLASIAGFLALVGGVAICREGPLFPAPSGLFPVVGTMLLIAAGPQTFINRVLSNGAAVFIGKISYPLYLWHWPLLSIPALVVGDFPDRSVRITAVAGAFVLAVATYFFVEKPIQRSRWRLPVKAGIATGALAIAGLAGIAIFQEGVPDRAFIKRNEEAQAQMVGPMWAYRFNNDCLTRYPLVGVESYGWWFCMLSKDRPATTAMVGSSYANHQYIGLARHPALTDETLLSVGTCEPSWVSENDLEALIDENPYSPCTPSRKIAQLHYINEIAAQGTVRLIILDGLNPVPSAEYIRRIRKRVDYFEHLRIRVVITIPHIRSGFHIQSCFGRPLAHIRSCDVEEGRIAAARTAFQPLIDAMQQSNPRTVFFDPNTIFCEGAKCSFIRDGKPLFRDEYSHLSEYGSSLLAEAMVRAGVFRQAKSTEN